jgi:hypothetical protein
MKKLILFAFVLLLAVGFASAKQVSCLELGYDAELAGSVGSIDTECQAHGFDFGIAKWEWDEEEFILESENSNYDTSVWGTNSLAQWTSNPDADGVLSKEGQCYQYLPGGSSGNVTYINYGISHVTLCGYDHENDVPEFGLIGAGLVVLGAAGFLIFRKK